ncbi:MAG: heterodisulfide reductase-related iron-sulfur binding cluster [Alphaproteobacteria bacterium]|nr:heterodisulfide reductase-related iron-sulfur binding cluster [Alphaproteobacteria bacterium]
MSIESPTRHPLDWTDPDFSDPLKIDQELRRVFDICHGCRRCFNLCDSFPRLFDLIDASPTGELDSVDSKDFAPVVDACTLCDMCFMVKCPYVPPHELNVDFPHLMLRYRAAEFQKGKSSLVKAELAKTDRNGKIAGAIAPVANWATNASNPITRPLMGKVFGIHPKAAIPRFCGETLVRQAAKTKPEINVDAPAYGQKVVIYATCFSNYNNPKIGLAAQAILAHNGIEAEVVYPGCCGMPSLEQGDLAKVSINARAVAAALRPWVDRGYAVIALIPSCALMLKSEWPLIVTDDDNVKALSSVTKDISEYIVWLARSFGLVPGLKSLGEDITLHIACHARAQNIGHKAAEMLRLIPQTQVDVIERCSGHGGTWGMEVDHFEVALKVGAPVANQAIKNKNRLVVSECPLAGEHILQGIQKKITDKDAFVTLHPIEILAQAYSL